MPVTSYPTAAALAFAGMIADQAPRHIESAVNKEAAAIPFGIGVKKGAGEDEAALPAAAGDVLSGIVVHRHDVNTIGSAGWGADAGVPVDDRFDLLRAGVVMVKVEEAVNQGDKAFVRFAAGAGGTQLGAWRKSADTATARAVNGAYFLKGAAAGGFAPLYFNFSTAAG